MSLEFKKKPQRRLIIFFVGLFHSLAFCLMSFFAFAENSNEELFHKNVQMEEILVLKVLSSDTIILENGQRIKLLGVDSYGPAPRPKIEYDQKGKPIEMPVEPTIPLEDQALVFAQDLMEGKKVKLEFDLEARDEKGNKTAYVYLPNGSLANVELLRQGFVKLRIRPPNVKHEDLLKKAYQEARKEQRGFLSY